MSETEEQPKLKQTLTLKIKDIEVDESWPCKADILERHKEIENLTPVILNVDAPLVFAIDAPWGGGKTTFIKLWQHYLLTKQNGAICLYFNAWENDFSDDPLLPMLAEFDDWLSVDKGEIKKLWKKTKELLPGLLKRGAIVTAKVATLGGLDLDKEYEKLASDFSGEMTNDLVSGFKSHKSILEQFKKNLGELTKALPDGQQNLIVFVDELDRCKPTYAIETLERIKHLFDIPNIVFVLAVNKEQLAKSIQGVYGNNFDGLNYLKRFIDIDYSLKLPQISHFINCKINTTSLFSFFENIQHGQSYREALEATICLLVKKFDYTLRDVEQMISKLNLICLSIDTKSKFNPIVLVSMLALYNENRSLYQKYLSDGFEANNVIEYLFEITPESQELPKYFGATAGWIINAAYDPDAERELSPLFEAWIGMLESIGDNSSESRELRILSNFLDGSRRTWDMGNVRLSCSRNIELMNSIKIN